MLEFNIELYTF